MRLSLKYYEGSTRITTHIGNEIRLDMIDIHFCLILRPTFKVEMYNNGDRDTNIVNGI